MNRDRDEIHSNAKINKSSKLKLKQRINNIDTKAALWRPAAPYLAISEVLVHRQDSFALGLQGRSSTHSPDEAAAAFQLAWSRIFASAGTCPPAGKLFATQYSRSVSWEWNLAETSSHQHTRNYYKYSRDSCPGWDGIPNAAYRYGGDCVCMPVTNLQQSIIEGGSVDDEFNAGVCLYPAKKLLASNVPGARSVSRDALAARPLTLKCTDNKGIRGFCCCLLSFCSHCMYSQIPKWVCAGSAIPE